MNIDPMMEAELKSSEIRCEGKSEFDDVAASNPESTTEQKGMCSECLTQATSFSEQISTEDTELSSTDVSVVLFLNKTSEVFVKCDLNKKPKGGVTRAVSYNSLCPVEKQQPKPLFTLLPPATCTIHEVHEASQSVASIRRSQNSVKTVRVHSMHSDEEDACAAFLLACLFCRPLDCLLATLRGCDMCLCSLCSSLCGCEPTVLQPLLDVSSGCELCSSLGSRCCCLCDCPVCDICLQATECLDLSMEISQMLYH